MEVHERNLLAIGPGRAEEQIGSRVSDAGRGKTAVFEKPFCGETILAPAARL
jgi:hypothetical protein